MLVALRKLDGIAFLMELNKYPLLPTSYFGPIGYYAILLQNPNVVIEQYEYFIKQTIRNRCTIYGANGKLILSIPKQRKSSSKILVKDLKISYNHPWQKKHWKSINSAYRSSPFFEFYEDLLFPLYQKKETFLLDFNLNLQKVILECLQFDKNIAFTDSYNEHAMNSFTDSSSYKINFPRYNQVFMKKHGFIPNLSIIDLLFNLGVESMQYLQNLSI